MSAQNYTTTILVDQSIEEVFTAISNPRSWWSEEIDGTANELNAIWSYHYQDVHRATLKVSELIPNQRVVWQVLENYFSFTQDKSEWTGTSIIFEISKHGDKTQLTFTHIGLVPEYECYDICENAWNTYIQESLFKFINTGISTPNGKDTPQTEDEQHLGQSNFSTTFFVNESAQQVFDAINNVRGWWQGDIEGLTNELNQEFSYRVEGVHYSKQRIVEFIPNETITWLVTESELNFVDDKNEWSNTTIVFEIKEINKKTQVRFTHVGLIPAFECYGGCSGAWERLIQESLVSLIRTGKGVNVFG